MDERPKTYLYARDKLWVWACMLDSGDLRIEGQDLGFGRHRPGASELEYSFTVAARDVPRVVAALLGAEQGTGGGPECGGSGGGASARGDVLGLLAVHGEAVVTEGESRWLARQGIEADYWQWVS